METTRQGEARAWVTVPEGGRILAGLGKSASYAAAARGDLPTLRVGRRLVVPVAKLNRLLGLEPGGVDEVRTA